MMAKISRTFSIDHKIYEKFEDICKSKNINKSKVIQDSIKNFIGENYDIDFNTDYKLKFGDNTEIVKITKKESEFVLLSNGNKMNIFDFEMLYEEEDQGVKQVLKDLQSEKGVDVDETIDPSEMFHKSVFGNPETVKKMFDNIDVKRFLEKTVDDEKNGKERVIIRDLTKEDDNPIIKDDRTFEDKKAEILEKWRSEERERRKIKETFDIEGLKKKLGTEKIESDAEKFLNQPTIEPIEFLKQLEEVQTLDRKERKDIIKRKSQRKEQIQNFKSIDIDNIKNTLEYIFMTDVEIRLLDLISQSVPEEEKIHYEIHMDSKYYGITELFSILSNLGVKYELKHKKELPLYERLKNRVNEIFTDSFKSVCDMISHKPTHMADTLNDILKGLINDNSDIIVKFDDPLYTIKLPEEIIKNGEYLLFFISTCYNIQTDRIILQTLESVLEN